jgi:hypothetical protein
MGSKKLKNLTIITNRPFVIMNALPEGTMKNSVATYSLSRANIFAVITFHELWLMTYAQTYLSRNVVKHFIGNLTEANVEECKNDLIWQNQVQEEIRDWEKIFPTNGQVSDGEFRQTVKDILNRRCNHGKPSKCWSEIRERIVGMGDYFGFSILMRSQLVRAENIPGFTRRFFHDERQHAPEFLGHGTGHMIAQSLDRLLPQVQWQKEVIGGYFPLDVLAKAVSPNALYCSPQWSPM